MVILLHLGLGNACKVLTSIAFADDDTPPPPPPLPPPSITPPPPANPTPSLHDNRTHPEETRPLLARDVQQWQAARQHSQSRLQAHEGSLTDTQQTGNLASNTAGFDRNAENWSGMQSRQGHAAVTSGGWQNPAPDVEGANYPTIDVEHSNQSLIRGMPEASLPNWQEVDLQPYQRHTPSQSGSQPEAQNQWRHPPLPTVPQYQDTWQNERFHIQSRGDLAALQGNPYPASVQQSPRLISEGAPQQSNVANADWTTNSNSAPTLVIPLDSRILVL